VVLCVFVWDWLGDVGVVVCVCAIVLGPSIWSLIGWGGWFLKWGAGVAELGLGYMRASFGWMVGMVTFKILWR